MDAYTTLSDLSITKRGPISSEFLSREINTFHAACDYVHQLPYGYNSNRDDLFTLFKEGLGSCTTKHAVIATLAEELGLSVVKTIGIYAMSEAIVSGTGQILDTYDLPFIPMVHCFLADGRCRVDLTDGNRNGKNIPIDDFLFTQAVEPNISGKAEYLLYRRALSDLVLTDPLLQGTDLKILLHAREAGLALLRENIRS
jgi:hypothetical protein